MATYFQKSLTPWATKSINDVAGEVGARGPFFHKQRAERQRFLQQIYVCINPFQAYAHLLSHAVHSKFKGTIPFETVSVLLAPLNFGFVAMNVVEKGFPNEEDTYPKERGVIWGLKS